MPPLSAERLGIGRVARDLVAQKQDEFGRGREAPDGSVDAGEGAFVRGACHAGTGVAVEDELVARTARHQRGNGAARRGPFIEALDLVFPEFHEAVAQVEPVRLAAGQDFEPHGKAGGIGFGEQRLQDCRAEAGPVQAAVEIERVDADFLVASAKADTADALTILKDQSRARFVEMSAERAARSLGRIAADPFEMLAHHIGAQGQKRFEIGFGYGTEAPGLSHERRSGRGAAWRSPASPSCRAPSTDRAGRR